MSKCNDYPINNIDAEDVPVWGKNVLPDEGYLLMAAKQIDQQCGRALPFLYHLPLNMVTPGGTFQTNTYSANGNGFTQEWATNQVRAGYTYNNTPNDMRLAGFDSHKAQYLILGKDDTIVGNYIIQGSGFYTFVGGHEYIPGYTYYLGLDGIPTTDSSYHDGARQKLFEVVDKSTILIDIDSEYLSTFTPEIH